MKKRYAFMHKTKLKWFGPYDSSSEARDAFQRKYGYWPGKVEAEEEWVSNEK